MRGLQERWAGFARLEQNLTYLNRKGLIGINHMYRRGLMSMRLSLTGAMAGASAQERFPERPLRLMVGFAPGGPTDVEGRRFAEKLGARSARRWVEDRTNANGSGGAIEVAQAQSDGYTLPLTTSSAPANFPQIAAWLRSVEEFQHCRPRHHCVGGLRSTRSLLGMVALVRASPDSLRFGSAGAGPIIHFGTKLFLRQASGLQLVPARGCRTASSATSRGRGHRRTGGRAPLGGRLRILAMLAEQRSGSPLTSGPRPSTA